MLWVLHVSCPNGHHASLAITREQVRHQVVCTHAAASLQAALGRRATSCPWCVNRWPARSGVGGLQWWWQGWPRGGA